MIPIHEAQRKLIHEGYTVDMQPIYRHLTILNCKYEDVKHFLTEQDYHGDIVVISRKEQRKYEQLTFGV